MVLAVTVGVTGLVAPVLPRVAGSLVLDRTGPADGGVLVSALSCSVEPVVVAVLVLVVAAAFRAGERMSRDVDGLV
jgi:hypothetical protein